MIYWFEDTSEVINIVQGMVMVLGVLKTFENIKSGGVYIFGGW